MNAGTGSFSITNLFNIGVGSSGELSLSTNTQSMSIAGIIGNGANANGSVVFSSGGGQLTLTGTNTYSGGTIINGGKLGAKNGSLGSGNVAINGGSVALGWGETVGNYTTANNFTLNGGALIAEDWDQRVSGTVNVTAASTLGSTYNNGGAELDKGLFLHGVVSGSAALTINHQFGAAATNPWNTSIVYFTNNANTYSGTITVNPGVTGSGGNFIALGGNGISSATALANATVNLAGDNPSNDRFGSSMLVFTTDLPEAATLGGLSGSDNVVLTEYNADTHAYGANSVALTVGNNNSTTTYSGIMSGGGSLTKTGSGNFTLSNTNTYTGGTTVNAGTLTISGVGGAVGGIRGILTINSGAAVVASSVDGFGYLAGQKVDVINVNGGLLDSTASGNQGWGITYNLTGGKIQSNGGVSSTTAASKFSFGKNSGGTPVEINTFASATTSEIAGRFDLRNDVANPNPNVDFTVANGAAATDLLVSAAITSSAGAAGITKLGAGAMNLTGANTYAGTTTVNAGTLAINGNQSGATGAVTVNNAGTRLQGAGTVGGSTTLHSGAIHAPGNSVATQNFSQSLTYTSGSIFEWELAASPAETAVSDPVNYSSNRGSAYDAVNVAGSLGGADAVFRVVLDGSQTFADAFWNQDLIWTDIFRNGDGSGTQSLDFASIFSSIAYHNASGAIVNTNTSGRSFSINGSSLTWSAVPEPSSALAGLLIGAGLLRRRRCRAAVWATEMIRKNKF